jgi:two-component system, chemotaxis family, protein-glutamate methylesterase/glutaminase
MLQVPQQAREPVTVLLVDDSPVALIVLQRILATSPDIKVVATARSGREALEMIPKYNPAVVCTDLHMPDMDGLELTRKILELYPRPVLVVSASTQKEDTHNVFRLLEAGAIDVVPKPMGGLESDYAQIARDLISKIKVLSGVYVFRRRAGGIPHTAAGATGSITSARIVVVGASTGGPQVLQRIFSKLPASYSLPIICIQHIAQGFLEGFADWLRGQVRLKVKIVQQHEAPVGGVIYIPPEGQQMEIDRLGRFSITGSEPVGGHAPSITVTMTSVAGYYKGGTVGILLSGMGSDGAEGMEAIVRAGGYTIAQDKESSTIFGMPKQAIDLGAANAVLGPEEIAARLVLIAEYRASM